MIVTADGKNFEDGVRRVARLLWNEDAFAGASVVGGRERDAIFETRDAINIVECTISRSRDKAQSDAKKTAELVQSLRKKKTKHVNGWLITAHEPTADQRDVVAKFSHSVRLLSMDQFRSLLFNGTEYLRCRSSYRFGSVADPVTRARLADVLNYVPINIFADSRGPQDSTALINAVVGGEAHRAVLLGEYGSGKSVTLRKLFFKLKDTYAKNTTHIVPVYLNLRDHTGQKDPIEALERHARNIAYPGNSSDLVRAWRGGFTALILDGFDEMATAGWGGSLQKVRAHRYSGMTLVRKFVEECPASTPIIIAGRHNFFDSQREMNECLGIKTFEVWRTQDFSEDQAAAFLRNQGIQAQLPDWIPKRPLLLAYLAAKGFLSRAMTSEASNLSPAIGWDKLLSMICEREAEQDDRLDPHTVRSLIERLATIARATEDGRGRIDIITIQNSFRDIAGFPPDEAAQQFILRLPGLGPTSLEDSSREFVDVQIAEVARAGDVIKYISHPYGDYTTFSSMICPLGSIATELIADKIVSDEIKPSMFLAAAQIAATHETYEQLSMDLGNILIRAPEVPCNREITIKEGVCEYLLIDDYSRKLSYIHFHDCLFHHAEVSRDIHPDNLPTFRRCLFGTLDGYFGPHDLPSHFIDCDVAEFSMGAQTSAQILGADIPEGLKILLTILRKLFLQPGSGRQETAFYRGAMDSRGSRLVPEVLSLISKHKIAERVRHRGKDIWLPNRSQTGRVHKMLNAPMTSVDSLVSEARDL
jgi:hypothetical protein